MVKPEIRKPEGLKGKKSGYRAWLGGRLLFGYVLRKYGIDIFTQTRRDYSAFAADFFCSFPSVRAPSSYLSVAIHGPGASV